MLSRRAGLAGLVAGPDVGSWAVAPTYRNAPYSEAVRVLLVANPSATSADTRTLRSIEAVLSVVAEVATARTTHRNHARDLAAAARDDGLDAVVVFAGDGTVGDVVDGLLARGPADDVPTLGVVPGGAANVLARTLGQPRGAVRSAHLVARALSHDSGRRLGLARLEVVGPNPHAVADRWVVLNAGLGLDAEAIARVEKARLRGRRASGLRYAASTIRAWSALDRTAAPLSLTSPIGEVIDLPMVIATNTDPWSYLGPHRLRPTPLASFDLGIDVLAPRAMDATSTLGSVGRMLTHRPGSDVRTFTAHDLPWVEVRSSIEVALQADGDYLGQVRGVRLTAVPRALRVLVA